MNKIIQGNNLEVLKTFEDNSIDSIVTDPPYELGFMGKKWDSTGIAYNVELWKECLRVLKSGGHLLAFSGTRTYHRMTCAIEDAGFEIRDMIQWIYGSGFPKSHNIGKAVDKLQGNERGVIGRNPNSRENCDKTNTLYESGTVGKTDIITKGNSPYEGWGTTLKPANEPICLARKPLSEKTVALNVLKHGTGGINIEECRIETKEHLGRPQAKNSEINQFSKGLKSNGYNDNSHNGRFPANVILDEEAGKMLDEQSGVKCGQLAPTTGNEPSASKKNAIYNDYSMVAGKSSKPKDNLDGASRFFYCAKASKSERNKGLEGFEKRFITQPKANSHPTVKPIKLMQYLCRLITPKGGIVLDPFNGSGTTGCACVLEGFNYIGIDLDSGYCKISEARIKAYQDEHKQEKLL